MDDATEMIDFLKREKVDVVVACDFARNQLVSPHCTFSMSADSCKERIDEASRKAGVMFYAAGTYGFYGYIFADLGEEYTYVHT